MGLLQAFRIQILVALVAVCLGAAPPVPATPRRCLR